MFRVKCYLYDSSREANGYRGTGNKDFSKYVLQGGKIKEDITQQLDVGELTLVGLPFREEFSGETKFIIDLTETTSDLPDKILQTYHYVVARDIVEQPILSNDNYFNHHISFIEPSVVAQKRLVDNISTTYKLKDVSLEEVSAFPDVHITFNMQVSPNVPSENFGYSSNCRIFGKYFQPEGNVAGVDSNGNTYTDIYNNIEHFRVGNQYIMRFALPKIAIMSGVYNTKNYERIGYASIDYTVEEFSTTDPNNALNRWTGSVISNSSLPTKTFAIPGNAGQLSDLNETYQNQWIVEDRTFFADQGSGDRIQNGHTDSYYKKYTDTSAVEPQYLTREINLSPDKLYKITVSLHQFDDGLDYTLPGGVYKSHYYKFTGSQPSYFLKQGSWFSGVYIKYTKTVDYLTARLTSGSSTFFVFSLAPSTVVYSSSVPYSALSLLHKAIINSSIYEKQNGVYIGDVNNSNLPFYVDNNFVDELSATTIIENFYNQKNLWEIMVEVGNYIHAIPELVFGNDDKFKITFNRLGRTDEHKDLGTRISIFNSRDVENYICATSSYITNMVQLGGYIEEWVVPKTTNDQLLVYNDTAEIIVSKPIIELLRVTVRRNSDGARADLTPFIYEENVYKTLSIDYRLVPNRGIAMFYKLGTEVITGGQYQLPTESTGEKQNDFTIKKIIWSAFNGYKATGGDWTDIRVNDYSFYVKYRTKDSVRQNHVRPDLRKYLVNSKYDKYPEHNQFNNQTDVVIDSIKFGNNMFGKLIKTGNSTYTVWEWVDNFSNLKHKGELYKIDGELYYVANAEHTMYSSYIISKVDFSKDYNELSSVIGIPSEPRFYEISEQSLIWREFAMNDALLLTDDESQIEYRKNYLFNMEHISNLMIGAGTDFAKYAITVYKGDKDANLYNQTVGERNTYIEILNAVNAYSSENTLTYEWDMVDNYSAGDKTHLTGVAGGLHTNSADNAYTSLQAVKYTDIYGRAALVDFYLLGDIFNAGENNNVSIAYSSIKSFPESPISTKQGGGKPFIGYFNILATNVKNFDTNYNGRGIGLLKDCREAMSFNYNLELITNSDTFVVSPYVFLPMKSNLRIVLLADEVNKLSNGYVDNSLIITPTSTQGGTLNKYFTFSPSRTTMSTTWGGVSRNVVTKFSVNLSSIFANVSTNHFNGTDGYQQVKAIAILCDVNLNSGDNTIAGSIPYKTQYIIARNIPSNWSKTKALSTWYFGAPNSNLFRNKQ